MPRAGLAGGQYQPLLPEEVERIHTASLTVLERTGIHVENETALNLFRRGGARIEGPRVHIPATTVEKALESAPSRVLLAGRDPEQDVVLEGNRVYAGTGGSPTSVLDPGEDSVRAATLRDLADLVKLADALPHCDFVVIPIHPTDVPEEDVPPNRFYTCRSRIRRCTASRSAIRRTAISGRCSSS